MLVDDEGLYFVTARGKAFYRQLTDSPIVAISALTKDWMAIRMVGDVTRVEERSLAGRVFDANPMMNDIYPGETRDILAGFHLYRGRGKFFDLSSSTPCRQRFAVGGAAAKRNGYLINEHASRVAPALRHALRESSRKASPASSMLATVWSVAAAPKCARLARSNPHQDCSVSWPMPLAGIP